MGSCSWLIIIILIVANILGIYHVSAELCTCGVTSVNPRAACPWKWSELGYGEGILVCSEE